MNKGDKNISYNFFVITEKFLNPKINVICYSKLFIWKENRIIREEKLF